MSLSLQYDELLRYTGAERDKWRRWFASHPDAMDIVVQPGGRLPTVGKLIDHIFLVERRHLQRLAGEPLSDRTGLTGNNAPPLFDYGGSVPRQPVRDDAPEVAVPHPATRDATLGTDRAGRQAGWVRPSR